MVYQNVIIFKIEKTLKYSIKTARWAVLQTEESNTKVYFFPYPAIVQNITFEDFESKMTYDIGWIKNFMM